MSYIPDELITLYNEVAEEFIDSDLTGSLCTVYYAGKKVECDCEFSGFGGGNYSQSVFSHGGPASANHSCTYCNNTGYRTEEVTEDIRLRVSFDKNKWKSYGNIQIPDADIATIGKVIDIPKINKCEYIKLPAKFQNYSQLSFSLAGNPLPHGFDRGNKFFVAFWKMK